jgi:hypothetical protein
MKKLESVILAGFILTHAATGAVARPIEQHVVACESTVQGIWLKPTRYQELILETYGGAGGTFNNIYAFAPSMPGKGRLIAKIAFTFYSSGGRTVENNFVEWPNGQREGVGYKSLSSGLYKFEYSFKKGGYLRCVDVSRD